MLKRHFACANGWVLFTLFTGCAPASEASPGLATEALTTFVVNSREDGADDAPGDGVCADGLGRCTLRAAIMETNALSGLDMIRVSDGDFELRLTAPGDGGGDLDIHDAVTIVGLGARFSRIWGMPGERVFDIDAKSSFEVSIEDLTIRGGELRDGQAGGGLRNAGESHTTLRHVIVRDNEAPLGGGLSNEVGAFLRLEDVEVRDNRATLTTGGGIQSDGPLEIEDTSIADNSATDAGGLSSSGALMLRSVSITGNVSERGTAGAVAAGGIATYFGTVDLENVTISGNRGYPGGLLQVSPDALLRNVTVAGNEGGGITNADLYGARTVLLDTIVAGGAGASGYECEGTVVSGGHNLDSGTTCRFGASGDQSGVDPRLGALAREMGRSDVRPISPSSPAWNAGDPGTCATRDQRAVPRGERCDIGAYEWQEAAFRVNTVDDAIDAAPGDGRCMTRRRTCSLRAAVMEANALPGPDTIAFDVDARFSLTLTGAAEDSGRTGDLDLLDDVTLRGNGPTRTIITNPNGDRVLDVGPGSPISARVAAFVTDVDISRAKLPNWVGGCVQVSDRAALLVSDARVHDCSARGAAGDGGAIANAGLLDVRGTEISSSSAPSSRGGGVRNAGGVFRMTDGSIVGCSAAEEGGGISNGPGGETTLVGVRIERNIAGRYGGGIDSLGELVATEVTIATNTAARSGAGLRTYGPASLTSCTVALNESTSALPTDASGIDATGGLTLINTTVSSNRGAGPGVYVSGRGDVTNSTIAYNDGAFQGADLHLANTIVAFAQRGVECGGTIVSAGHNLDSGSTCGFGSAGDLSGVDPRLGSLANWGGPTDTHRLDSSSPAVDAGDDALCPAVDQRGYLRRPPSDIGSYEY